MADASKTNPDLVGIWRLVGGSISDETGAQHGQPYGAQGKGLLSLTAEGHMMAVLVDAAPEIAEGSVREYASYCGTYTFDGAVLVTMPYACSAPRFAAPQLRRVRLEAGRLILNPPGFEADGRHITRELVWERICTISL